MSARQPRDEAGTRRTPYELVFGLDAGPEVGQSLPEARLDTIDAEAEQRGVDTSDPQRFVQLAQVGTLLRELVPEGSDAAVLLDMGLFLFQAYQFRRFGHRLYRLEAALARRLLADGTVPADWTLRAPAPAGYLQLPRHLVWARIAEEAAAEPVDGLFWTLLGHPDPALPPFARIDLLLVLGMRPDRPGFSVVGVTAGLPEPDAPGARRGQAGGAEFANILPGGEMRGLHAVTTEIGALQLARLAFHHAAVHPDAIEAPAAASQQASATASALPAVVLRDADAAG